MTKQSRVPVVARLVTLGLAENEIHARELIDRHVVLAGGTIVDNPSRLVTAGESLIVREIEQFVSRGGVKLARALDAFAIDVAGKVVLDIGASTGGFTDCTLQAGARLVYSLDVGKTQLHERIRNDDRVVVVEEFNARQLTDVQARQQRGLPDTFDLVVVDVSFISVARLAPEFASILTTDSDLVILIKPQFEATRDEASRGSGVITSGEVHARVVEEVKDAMAASGCECLGVIESPITGASGNTEFLAHFRMRS